MPRLRPDGCSCLAAVVRSRTWFDRRTLPMPNGLVIRIIGFGMWIVLASLHSPQALAIPGIALREDVMDPNPRIIVVWRYRSPLLSSQRKWA